MREHPSISSSPLVLLAFTAFTVACSPAGETKPKSADAPASDAPPVEVKAHAGDAPTQAHDGGMPPGHPAVPAGPMMGNAPAKPATPENPREVTPSGEARAEAFAEIKVDVPTEWTRRPPQSSMRLAELVLPGPGGDTPLAIYRFPGGAGGVESNINRWKGQFVPPEGKTIDEVTKVVTEERGPLKITRVDIQGTNNAEVMPGEGERHNAPGSRMLAAIVEGSGDPFFFKVVGPSATVDVWAPAFETMLASAAVGE